MRRVDAITGRWREGGGEAGCRSLPVLATVAAVYLATFSAVPHCNRFPASERRRFWAPPVARGEREESTSHRRAHWRRKGSLKAHLQTLLVCLLLFQKTFKMTKNTRLTYKRRLSYNTKSNTRRV